jgi:phosphinothricin acetyltransferase
LSLAEYSGLALAVRESHEAGVSAADIQIRDAHESDAGAIAQIYAHHVLHGTASYDIEPHPVEYMLAKVRAVSEAGWPFLVAHSEGAVVGFAYATQFRDRAAYRYTCENSIYLHPRWIGRGIGKQLLEALISQAERCGFRQMIAVIGGAEPASVALHAACGFYEAGRLHAVGWKKEKWLDNVYMQRELLPVASNVRAMPDQISR